MAEGHELEPVDEVATTDVQQPSIQVCESCPGTVVFLESGNTDGWIASDVSVSIPR